MSEKKKDDDAVVFWVNHFRDTDEIICIKKITQKGNGYMNEYLIMTTTNHSSSNHKYLNIRKFYWDNGWKPTKQGLLLPIKDGKAMIKEIYEKLFSVDEEKDGI